MLAIQTTAHQPLKYYSGSLSTCIHILILFFVFAQTYKKISEHGEAAASAPYEEESLLFDDLCDNEEVQEPQHVENQLSEQTIQEEFLENSSPREKPAESDTQKLETISTAALQVERRLTYRPRLERSQKKWRKKAEVTSHHPPEKIQTAAQQMGSALQNNYNGWKQAEQQAFNDFLREHHSTVDDLQRERHDYHMRVLQAIKATTQFFVKNYYATRAFVTPKIHVSIELAPDGKIVDVKIEPSTASAELDQAIRNFVYASHFSKKPLLLQKIPDGPYDFYILPLTILQGENILKLVAHF